MGEKKVIVYSTQTCPHCSNVKAYLLQKGIEFEDYDVSQDKEKAKEMIIKSGQKAVPVLEINGRIVVGFDRKLIEDALSRERLPTRDEFLQNLFFDPFSK